MVKITLPASDPTLEEIHRLYLLKQDRQNEERRIRKAAGNRYIGASKIGHDCARHIWYDMTGAPQAPATQNAGAMAAEDGHNTEAMLAARLRIIPTIELHTHDKAGNQYGFNWGFMRGNYDGVIRGILQAPATFHIWEAKRANPKKFKKLRDLINEDEKSALEKWDKLYYCQAIVYMHAEDLTRHYLTCGSDGGTEMAGVRTNANPKYAKALRAKAQRIVAATEPPERAGRDASAPVCMFCPYKGVCHG